MSYYMRFITNDLGPASLGVLQGLVHIRRGDHRLQLEPDKDPLAATVIFDDDPVGMLEVNLPGDGTFDEELQELLEFVADSGHGDRGRVEDLLRSATGIFAVQVLSGGHGIEASLSALDSLWDSLFERHKGLLQADGEGYYDRSELILEVE